MRFINFFLIGYFIVIVGAVLGLWQAGALTRVSPMWIGAGALVAIGAGIVMSVVSGTPAAIAKIEPPAVTPSGARRSRS